MAKGLRVATDGLWHQPIAGWFVWDSDTILAKDYTKITIFVDNEPSSFISTKQLQLCPVLFNSWHVKFFEHRCWSL